MRTKAFDIFNAKVNRYFAQGMSEENARATALKEMRENPNIMNTLKTEANKIKNTTGGDLKSTVLALMGEAQLPITNEVPVDQNVSSYKNKQSLKDWTPSDLAQFAKNENLSEVSMKYSPEFFQAKQALEAKKTPIAPYDPSIIQSAFGVSYQYAPPSRGFINALRAIKNKEQEKETKQEEAKVLKDMNMQMKFKKATEKLQSKGGGGSGGALKEIDYKKQYDDLKSDYSYTEQLANGIIRTKGFDVGPLVVSGIGLLSEAIDNNALDSADALAIDMLNTMNDPDSWVEKVYGEELDERKKSISDKEKIIAQQYFKLYYNKKTNNEEEAAKKAWAKIRTLKEGLPRPEESKDERTVIIDGLNSTDAGKFKEAWGKVIESLYPDQMLESLYKDRSISEKIYGYLLNELKLLNK